MGSNRRYSGAALVFCGGALGTLLRYLIDVASVRVSGFALDIFIINVVGAFILAFLVGWITGAGEPTRNKLRLRLFLGTGMMGGFTTYSTLAVETAHNLGDGRWTSALCVRAGSVGSWGKHDERPASRASGCRRRRIGCDVEVCHRHVDSREG